MTRPLSEIARELREAGRSREEREAFNYGWGNLIAPLLLEAADALLRAEERVKDLEQQRQEARDAEGLMTDYRDQLRVRLALADRLAEEVERDLEADRPVDVSLPHTIDIENIVARGKQRQADIAAALSAYRNSKEGTS